MYTAAPFVVFFVFHLYFLQTFALTNNTEKFQIIVPEREIASTAQTQADLIKQIILNQKDVEYPVVTRKESIFKDATTKEEKERESIEELRRKCQQLFIHSRNHTEISEENTRGSPTIETTGPNTKPEYLEKTTVELPVNFSKPIREENITNKYFFITRDQSEINEDDAINDREEIKLLNARGNSVVTNPQMQNFEQPNANVRYVQLEPVILQRMTLSNGRTMFYWYKSIPAISQFVAVPKLQSRIVPDSLKYPTFQYPSQLRNAQLSSQTPFITNPTQIAASYQSGPTYSQSSIVETMKSKEPEQNTTQTPSYEVEYGRTEQNDNLYTKRMKFVIPMPYQPPNGYETDARLQGHFDPYAYYPKRFQPSIINVPLPYLPTFHMIKMLRIPENENMGTKDEK